MTKFVLLDFTGEIEKINFCLWIFASHFYFRFAFFCKKVGQFFGFFSNKKLENQVYFERSFLPISGSAQASKIKRTIPHKNQFLNKTATSGFIFFFFFDLSVTASIKKKDERQSRISENVRKGLARVVSCYDRPERFSRHAPRFS